MSAGQKGVVSKWRKQLLRKTSVSFVLSVIKEMSRTKNCLEGNTMSNRGAYSTKERMPSDRHPSLFLSAWKAVPD